MSEETKKSLWYLAICLIVLAIGFFIGRSTIKKPGDPQIIYVPGDTVKITKDSLVPVYIKKPIDTANVLLDAIASGNFDDLFPVKDSIIYVTKDDSSAVIRDWATERLYDETLFDIDTVGTEQVQIQVQYNRIGWIKGTFVPIQKQTTITEEKVKKFAPFVGAGITTMPEIGADAGVFLDDKYGVALRYLYDWERSKHAAGLSVYYKF